MQTQTQYLHQGGGLLCAHAYTLREGRLSQQQVSSNGAELDSNYCRGYLTPPLRSQTQCSGSILNTSSGCLDYMLYNTVPFVLNAWA